MRDEDAVYSRREGNITQQYGDFIHYGGLVSICLFSKVILLSDNLCLKIRRPTGLYFLDLQYSIYL